MVPRPCTVGEGGAAEMNAAFANALGATPDPFHSAHPRQPLRSVGMSTRWSSFWTRARQRRARATVATRRCTVRNAWNDGFATLL